VYFDNFYSRIIHYSTSYLSTLYRSMKTQTVQTWITVVSNCYFRWHVLNVKKNIPCWKW